jgi:hypothetical protein
MAGGQAFCFAMQSRREPAAENARAAAIAMPAPLPADRRQVKAVGADFGAKGRNDRRILSPFRPKIDAGFQHHWLADQDAAFRSFRMRGADMTPMPSGDLVESERELTRAG